ncbi:hypothetical protein [Streptomyces sp. NBC_00691]|uniref:hypothetical protein n=1 Tax=Streptomyces sp. NBC_00691 TaxID=2903671 RepID=UPI002E36ACDE|nr:hypothetical protein [Streptomyces sp. NBC_00691]
MQPLIDHAPLLRARSSARVGRSPADGLLPPHDSHGPRGRDHEVPPGAVLECRSGADAFETP